MARYGHSSSSSKGLISHTWQGPTTATRQQQQQGARTRPQQQLAWAQQLQDRLPLALLLLVVAWAVLGFGYIAWSASSGSARHRLPGYLFEPVLVSYAYYEKDPLQLANFEYFLAVGSHYPRLHSNMHWVFTVSGEACTPCTALYSVLPQRDPADLSVLGIKEARFSPKFTLLVRSENAGMDLGSHNVTLEWLSYRGQLSEYKYFIFINSSVKGPFLPAWVPPEWHWTAAYLSAFQPGPDSAGGTASAADPRASAFPGYSQSSSSSSMDSLTNAPPVHAVSSSLVCLPADDAGGPGPRLESWAFALDQPGLAAAIQGGVFIIRGCKLCRDADRGVVVGGEYGITTSMFNAGFNIATLLSRYARGLDWSDPQHWSCNDNVHPSRAGLYDGISVHPYETVFVKATWHVAEPYTKRYSQWQLQHLLGKAGTEGTYNQRLYRFGVSKAAENPPDLEQAYKPVLRP